MTERAHPRARLAWATAVLGTLALHAAYKLAHGLFGEMLWACHVATLSIGFGILARRTWLVAAGTLFHVAVGFPAYVLDVIAVRATTFTSVLVHTVPPVAGLAMLRHATPWPRWIPVAAGSFYIVLLPISRWLTDPALNVNLAFTPWPPVASLSRSPWLTWFANVIVMAVVLPIVDHWLRRWSAPLGARGTAHG